MATSLVAAQLVKDKVKETRMRRKGELVVEFGHDEVTMSTDAALSAAFTRKDDRKPNFAQTAPGPIPPSPEFFLSVYRSLETLLYSEPKVRR